MQLRDRIGRRIKLQDVHVLMTVVQAGSMNKAARLLNTSQPNISKSIADLEHAIGVRLLDRHRQGVQPTEFGRALLDGGSAVFDELRQTVKKIEFLADPTAGEVRIGASPLLAATFVSAVIDRLSARYPRIKFHLVTGLPETLLEGLRERNFDLLIARKFGRVTDERTDFEFLFEEPSVVAVGTQSAWARRRKIALPELVGEPWVLPLPGSNAVWSAFEAIRAEGIPQPNTVVTTDSVQVRMSLLATGRFLTILLYSALRVPAQGSQLKALPIVLPTRFSNGVVTLKDRSLSPVAKLFVDAARQVATKYVSV
jgi:DNA-binding transcriptional LysR family regulator